MKNIILISLVLCASTFPLTSRAQAPFGGLGGAKFPCTCSLAFTWQSFTPLYLGGLIPTIGALAVPVTPFTYANYYSLPGSWLLGFYTPGVQSCMIYVGIACVTLPTLGVVTPFTGSSLAP